MKSITKIFSGKKVRCFIQDNEPYFSVYDVCDVLGMKNSRQQTSTLKKDGVRIADAIDNLGRQQKLTIINEANLYRLIFRSKKEESKIFQDWIFEEVIPSIRKTGQYSIPDEVKKISTENRTLLTTEWQKHGITKPHEYINLTLQEYKCLGVPNKRKKDLTRGEMLLLSALESMEMLKLFNDAENNIKGYYDCKDSLITTTKQIKEITGNK
jgi:prophage antirepressor-like protein